MLFRPFSRMGDEDDRMKDKDLIVIDQTIREGMQYRGLMFSLEERKRMVEFQEKLGVDISQAAYPPAHESESRYLKSLHQWSVESGHRVRIAGLCRAIPEDVNRMLDIGIRDFHLHSGINKEMLDRFGMDEIFKGLTKTVGLIKSKVRDASINLALADVAATDFRLLTKCISYAVNDLSIDTLNLPDTSGSMAPNQYQDFIKKIAKLLKGKASQIAVHCHNDMGMASANTVMGVIAGAKVIEVTALGIGERNGIGDLYSVCKQLKDQGYNINVRTDDLEGFKAYYAFVNEICIDKLGEGPLNYNTPIFGESVKTHVAGTHGIIRYSNAVEKNYYLNVLCGKHLVKQYLNLHQIPYERHRMKEIVKAIKNKSVELNRGLSEDEVKSVINLI